MQRNCNDILRHSIRDGQDFAGGLLIDLAKSTWNPAFKGRGIEFEEVRPSGWRRGAYD